MSDVTQILHAIDQGDPRAAEQLLPLVYEELRKLAAQKLAQEKPGQTLEATALVHEAYLRLVRTPSPSPNGTGQIVEQWNSRGHFFAAAAEATSAWRGCRPAGASSPMEPARTTTAATTATDTHYGIANRRSACFRTLCSSRTFPGQE
jgi:hypothetical protein